jgi:hypothetical protein
MKTEPNSKREGPAKEVGARDRMLLERALPELDPPPGGWRRLSESLASREDETESTFSRFRRALRFSQLLGGQSAPGRDTRPFPARFADALSGALVVLVFCAAGVLIASRLDGLAPKTSATDSVARPILSPASTSQSALALVSDSEGVVWYQYVSLASSNGGP